jgi:hypothetical protein
MSVNYGKSKSYFDLKNGQLTLENVPVPPPTPLPKESGPVIALDHSLLVYTVVKRLLPLWETQVQDQEKGSRAACTLLRELEVLTKSRGSELIVLIDHGNWEGSAESRAVEDVLRCMSDPATRVFDLEPALSELKAKDRSRYDQLYQPPGYHMTAECGGSGFLDSGIS